MFLDLIDGYGQTDRELLRKQVAQETNLQWAPLQQSKLYGHITAYVLTAVGLSLECSIKGSVVQGGGNGSIILCMEINLQVQAQIREAYPCACGKPKYSYMCTVL